MTLGNVDLGGHLNLNLRLVSSATRAVTEAASEVRREDAKLSLIC